MNWFEERYPEFMLPEKKSEGAIQVEKFLAEGRGRRYLATSTKEKFVETCNLGLCGYFSSNAKVTEYENMK